jgi:carbonic anhydrase
MLRGVQALERLREGNRRFVSRRTASDEMRSQVRVAGLVKGQEPFAIVLGCSDSRVPAEIIFDQGLGDLFVIRVVGNIATPSQIGSVEFAAGRFRTRLVVVLGHSNCGAVVATLAELQGPPPAYSRNLRSILDRVRPAVERVLESSPPARSEDLLQLAVRANVRNSADRLRQRSLVLERLVHEEGLLIVGAEYSLETGVVDFFER